MCYGLSVSIFGYCEYVLFCRIQISILIL